MRALQDMPISFPGLFGDWSFNPDPIAVHIGHGIYWYGIILAIGLLAGLVLCMKQAKRYGLTEDNVLDMVLWAVPSCIIGARLYYVIFYLDLYRNADGSLNWGEMVARGEAATDQERRMAEIFQHGGDFVREEALDEIVRWFREGPHDGEVKAVPSVDI